MDEGIACEGETKAGAGFNAMTILMTMNFRPDAGRVPKPVSLAVMEVVKANDGQPLNIVVKTQKRYSSDPQRKYYYGVLLTRIQGFILSQGGKFIDIDDLHAYFMVEVGKFTRERHLGHGEIAIIRRSYTDLSTQEAEEYHLKLRRWGAERGLDLPEPNEGV